MPKRHSLSTADGFELASVWTRSSGRALVIWLHGICVDKNEYLNLFTDGASYIKAQGIDSFRFDFRGHGESAGSSTDFSIAGQMLDLAAAFRFVNTCYKGNSPPIVLAGCSFGAPPAIFAALRRPDIVQGIVLIAPVLSYDRTFLHPETAWASEIFSSEAMEKAETSNHLRVNEKFDASARLIEEMRLISPDLALAQLSQQVTIVHGEADSMVPFDVSREVAARQPRIRFIAVENMDHGFTAVGDDEGTGSDSMRNRELIYQAIVEACG